MKIVRVEYNNDRFHGILDGKQVHKIDGNIFGDFSKGEESFSLEELQILAPVSPPNIVAIGLNYRKHAREGGSEIPKRPVIFLKPTTSVVGPGEDILLPHMAPDEVDYEAELAVIIGRLTKDVEPEAALDYVFGYTCGNDVSARDCQLRLDVQWARGKSFDTFCPLGPWIETELNPSDCKIKTVLNDQVMQDSNTEDMIFSVRELVSYCSKNMTLLPGTVIMTGTPEGVGCARKPPVYLREGDSVQIKIEGIGTLENQVSAEQG